MISEVNATVSEATVKTADWLRLRFIICHFSLPT